MDFYDILKLFYDLKHIYSPVKIYFCMEMKKKDTHCDLKSCFLCRGCLAGWLAAIEANRQNLRFRKGEIIFQVGSRVAGIYFLYKGKVKVHQPWGLEKELILHFAKEGDILGYRGLGNEKIYPVSATALEDSVLCFIQLPFFETTLQVNHQLTYSLMNFYANELQEAERRMRNLALMDVKGRVAATLLSVANDFGQNDEGYIGIRLTKQDLAAYSGTTYETFSRMINDLVKEGIISVSGKNIAILKSDMLENLTSYR